MCPLPPADARPADETIRYGHHPDQVYDVRRPRGPRRDRTAVLIHGGFWRPAYDRAHAAPQAEAFADSGFHVAAIEYRRAERGGWMAMAADVRAALRAVRDDPDLPSGTVVVGHSAGGHLTAWLLHQPEAAGVIGGVSLAGCVDLALVDRLDLDGGAARDLFGCRREQDPTTWDAADPALLGPTPAPLRLVHGTDDERVPLQVSQSYARAVGTADHPVDLRVLQGCTHFDLIDPASPHFAPTLEAATI